jgi:hypothetical protein
MSLKVLQLLFSLFLNAWLMSDEAPSKQLSDLPNSVQEFCSTMFFTLHENGFYSLKVRENYGIICLRSLMTT